MIKNALNYKEELRELFNDIAFDPKYQYYFGSSWRGEFEMTTDDWRRYFVSLDNEGNVIGYISYAFNPNVKLVSEFGAINFSDNKVGFGRDLLTVIDEVFTKFGMKTLEFSVICGNLVEKTYDRLVKKFGGEILSIRHNRAQDLFMNLCDDKLYEITSENYLKAKAKRNLKHG